MFNTFKLLLFHFYGKLERAMTVIPSDVTLKVNFDNAQKKVFVFWTGDNEITENRKRCLEVLKQKTEVEVKLVTANELKKFEHPDFPFHPGYYYLSLNHRSDYLRCYFMHVYGGAYSDIKENLYSWNECFDKLNRSDKWLLGYPEIAPSGVASKDITLRRNYFQLIGNGSIICKPRTPFTEEWFGIVNNLLDKNLEKLKEYPSDMWGKNEGYPLRWAEVKGDLFHPLLFKHRYRVMHDKRIILSFKNYR